MIRLLTSTAIESAENVLLCAFADFALDVLVLVRCNRHSVGRWFIANLFIGSLAAPVTLPTTTAASERTYLLCCSV